MRRQAASISATDLDQRLPLAGGNDELGRLGRTLNEMLARIHTSVERERALVSDASHELRSPLAVLRTELELIGRERPAGRELQSAIGSAIEETDRLSQLADDLLLLARAEDQWLTVDPGSVSAAELLQRAADRARRHPNAARKLIAVDAPDDTDVLADRDRTDQARAAGPVRGPARPAVARAGRRGGGGRSSRSRRDEQGDRRRAQKRTGG